MIWDIAASAWVIQPEWVRTSQKPSPILWDFTWQLEPIRRPVEIAEDLNRDAISEDLFSKIRKA